MLPSCVSIYKKCRDDKELVEINARMKNALITMGCFFTAYWNGKDSYLFGHFQLNHHRGGNLVKLQTSVLEDVEVLGLEDVIRLAGYDPVLYLLALRCS